MCYRWDSPSGEVSNRKKIENSLDEAFTKISAEKGNKAGSSIDNPLEHRNSLEIRVSVEFEFLKRRVATWQTRLRRGDITFKPDFDPDKVIKDALKIDGKPMEELEKQDWNKEAKRLEELMWIGWLENYGYEISTDRGCYRDPQRDEHFCYKAIENIGPEVRARCRELGINIIKYASVRLRHDYWSHAPCDLDEIEDLCNSNEKCFNKVLAKPTLCCSRPQSFVGSDDASYLIQATDCRGSKFDHCNVTFLKRRSITGVDYLEPGTPSLPLF